MYSQELHLAGVQISSLGPAKPVLRILFVLHLNCADFNQFVGPSPNTQLDGSTKLLKVVGAGSEGSTEALFFLGVSPK